MGLIVQKYGGTSVGTIERILRVADRIASYKEEGHDVVVVVSAMGKSTDVLVDMAKQISAYPSERELDMLLTTGSKYLSPCLQWPCTRKATMRFL